MLFGLFSVTAMLLPYAYEGRSPFYVLGLVASRALGLI